MYDKVIIVLLEALFRMSPCQCHKQLYVIEIDFNPIYLFYINIGKLYNASEK